MKKFAYIPVALAGFIGGVAFLVACGGGSGSGLNSTTAAVPTEQMFCRPSDAQPRPTTILEGCFDSNGNNRANITIPEVLAEGWRANDGTFRVWDR